MTVGLLISGELGNIALKYFVENYNIIFVLTDKSSEKIIEFCKKNKVAIFVGNPRTDKINNFIIDKKCEIIVSINYIYLIKKNIINLAEGLCFNIHGSLLPKYRGRTPHVWAIINGEKETGITAHVIDEGCDTGDIIDQIKIIINENDTGWDILEKYKINYIPLINSVLSKYKSNSILLTPQDEQISTFFPKRTPNDGIINWNWNSKKIINWIRAQSKPYPGAFCFYKKDKIIIDKASIVHIENTENKKNGTIICSNPVIVKTQDSALKIESLRDNNIELEINEILF
jgi:methionyl-tRNA formyltransferase